MTRWVLLRHALADRTAHLDWMLERPAPDLHRSLERCHQVDGSLLSFRLAAAVDLRTATRFEAEAIGDHRREYLEYDGPVSGDRGMVQRVLGGTCDLNFTVSGNLAVDLLLDGRHLRFVGSVVRPAMSPGDPGARWVFEVAREG